MDQDRFTALRAHNAAPKTKLTTRLRTGTVHDLDREMARRKIAGRPWWERTYGTMVEEALALWRAARPL